MIVSEKHKFAFVHIPKTGGSSITSMLAPHLDKTSPTDGFGWQCAFHKTPMHYRFTRVPANFFSFTFVRNPWDWLVSMYDSGACKRWFQKPDTFQTFIELACSNPEPQLRWFTRLDEIKVDHVARFENFEAECGYIFQRIGLEINEIPHCLERFNRPHYRDWYSAETRTRVAEGFREDIRKFNYKF